MEKLPPRMVEDRPPVAARVLGFTHFFTRLASRISLARPASSHSSPDTTKLEDFDLFLKEWPSLTSKICIQDRYYIFLSRFCCHVDPKVSLRVQNTVNENSVYQQIAQYSIVSRNLPLLLTLQQYLKKHKPSLLESVFNSCCPGTNVRLVHMAADLGYTDVLRTLRASCTINVYDSEQEQRTPLAWAAEKSHFDTVEWLIVEGEAAIDSCRLGSSHRKTSSKYNVSLVTILAGLENDEGFFKFFGIHGLRLPVSEDDLPPALFCALTKGHIRVAETLVALGARLAHPVSFYCPGTSVYYSSKTIAEIAIDCESLIALDTLTTVSHRKHKVADHQQHLRQVAKTILTPVVLSCLAESEFLYAPQIVGLLLQARAASSKYSNLPEYYRISGLRFDDFLRKALHTQQAYKWHQSPIPRQWLLSGLREWDSMPDDLCLLLLRLGYLDIPEAIDTMLVSISRFQRCSGRASSRIFLDFINLAEHSSRRHLLDELVRRICTSSISTSIAMLEAIAYNIYICYDKRCVIMEHLHSLDQQPAVKAILEANKSRPFSETYGPKNLPSTNLIQPIKDAFHFSRCCRTYKGNLQRAERMYEDLKHIPDNYDLSLNFPAGYMKINKRYVVKISIVGAFYRWNYRLRRRNNRPFSLADVAYAKAVGLPISEDYHDDVGAAEFRNPSPQIVPYPGEVPLSRRWSDPEGPGRPLIRRTWMGSSRMALLIHVARGGLLELRDESLEE